MITAGLFLGASLFAMLVGDMCCLPVNKGFNPSHSSGKGYTNVAPSFGSNQGQPSSHFSPGQPGFVMPERAPSKHVAAPSYQPVPQLQPLRAEEMLAGTHGVGSHSAEYMSPPLGPVYQGGELSHYEASYETGDDQKETEEQGHLPPPPSPPIRIHMSAGQGFTSLPQPQYGLGRSWHVNPYEDYMFLTGQYPPGTVTHFSSNFEQGRDHWQDSHYVAHSPRPAQQLETFTGAFAPPQRFEEPWFPVKGGSEQSGAAAVQPDFSHGSFMQPTHSQAGGYNPGKVAY